MDEALFPLPVRAAAEDGAVAALLRGVQRPSFGCCIRELADTAHLLPNVEAERLPPARRLGREANDATGRLAAQVPCRWQSARATG